MLKHLTILTCLNQISPHFTDQPNTICLHHSPDDIIKEIEISCDAANNYKIFFSSHQPLYFNYKKFNFGKCDLLNPGIDIRNYGTLQPVVVVEAGLCWPDSVENTSTEKELIFEFSLFKDMTDKVELKAYILRFKKCDYLKNYQIFTDVTSAHRVVPPYASANTDKKTHYLDLNGGNLNIINDNGQEISHLKITQNFIKFEMRFPPKFREKSRIIDFSVGHDLQVKKG